MLDSGFYAGAERIGTFLLANLVTAFLLLTLLGAPFGLLGLFAIVNDWVGGRQPEFFRVYFGSIKRHWQAALALGAIDLVAGGLVIFNLSIFPMMALQEFLTVLSLTMTLCFAAVFLMANLYAWSIISLLSLPWQSAIKLSFLLVLSHPLKSVLIMIATLTPLIVSLFLPIAFTLILTLAVGAYFAARGTRWVLTAHFPAEELAALMVDAHD